MFKPGLAAGFFGANFPCKAALKGRWFCDSFLLPLGCQRST